MKNDLTSNEARLIDREILTVFDNNEYAKLAVQNQEKYQANTPFPHIYFDDFLPEHIAITIADEYPEVSSLDSGWKFHNNENVSRYLLEDTTKFHFRMRLFAEAITSRQFLLFLETLTGINSILADPYFIGGGAMLTGRDQFLKIHADFNFHHKLQAWRRVNALFYLSPGWDTEWGGNLELWSNDGENKVQEIAPLFNRVVIFNTTSDTFHGQPEPLRCPENVYRKVFSAFYYSTEMAERTESDPHFTKYSIENNPYAKQIGEDYKKSGY